MIHTERLDENTIRIPKQGDMLTDALIFARDNLSIESEAMQQLCDAAGLDADAQTFATPDIHSGYGVPIGCVWATPHFISPAAVGYDINCGMRLMTTPLEAAAVDVKTLADSIRRDVPLGEGQHNLELPRKEMLRFLAEGVPAVDLLVKHNQRFAEAFRADELAADLLRIEEGGAMKADPECIPARAVERGQSQFGTLGGGNHFLELQRVDRLFDEPTAKAWGLFEGQFVVMEHSGSRGLGHEVGGHFMKIGLKYDQQHNLPYPNRDLAYLPINSPEGHDYYEAMKCAANFAYANRQVMATFIRHNLRHMLGDIPMPLVYDVAHNMAKFEHVDGIRYCIHRKGATRAFPPSLMAGTVFAETGQPVLIPGSMGTASYLLAGIESGRRSLYSVNHGAGRVMSRTAAAGRVTRGGKVLKPGAISDRAFREAMDHVYLICEDRFHVKEEAPQAYKDIEAVIDTVAGAGLAKRVARLVPLAVLKG
jgi:tRNA-splicing ligase RtcB